MSRRWIALIMALLLSIGVVAPAHGAVSSASYPDDDWEALIQGAFDHQEFGRSVLMPLDDVSHDGLTKGTSASGAGCADGSNPDLIVNWKLMCNMDPRPVIIEGRTLVGLRAVTDSLCDKGMCPVVDYWETTNDAGETAKHVSVANRHNELLLTIGNPLVRLWGPSPGGSMYERQSLMLDVSPQLIDGTTRVPLRAIVEGLGGTIPGWTGAVSVLYYDPPDINDMMLADAMVEDASHAYWRGAITLDDLYFLSDYQRAAIESEDEPFWYARNPWAYIRFRTISQKIQRNGKPLTQSDYETISFWSVTALGVKFTWQEIQAIGRMGEASIDIVATRYGWAEKGTDPYTAKEVDFSGYNAYKRSNLNANGPDRMYVAVDGQGKIRSYLVAEGKATMRPWVSPGRFAENSPMLEQFQRLAAWDNAAVSRPFKIMLENMAEYARLQAAGKLTAEEAAMLLQPIRVATSPKGGLSRGAIATMQKQGAANARVTVKGDILGADLPATIVPPPEDKE